MTRNLWIWDIRMLRTSMTHWQTQMWLHGKQSRPNTSVQVKSCHYIQHVPSFIWRGRDKKAYPAVSESSMNAMKAY